MIKGLVITPPILGRISIGKIVERNGKRLPEKDDQFTITTQVQGKDGFIPHPYDEDLRKGQENRKIRAIPIRLLFNEPHLNLRAEYSLFDRATGRPICTGNGELCRRFTAKGMQTLPCPTPDYCELGKNGLCKPYGRLNVLIGKDDEDVGTFIFRTTGYNSIRTLAARLAYYQAVSGNLLACMSLELRLRAKSTTQSHRTPIYYADITVPEGQSLAGIVAEAKTIAEVRQRIGFDQTALDESARLGFANGAFEESAEEIAEIADEFFPTAGNDGDANQGKEANATSARSKPALKDKLDSKAKTLADALLNTTPE